MGSIDEAKARRDAAREKLWHMDDWDRAVDAFATAERDLAMTELRGEQDPRLEDAEARMRAEPCYPMEIDLDVDGMAVKATIKSTISTGRGTRSTRPGPASLNDQTARLNPSTELRGKPRAELAELEALLRLQASAPHTNPTSAQLVVAELDRLRAQLVAAEARNRELETTWLAIRASRRKILESLCESGGCQVCDECRAALEGKLKIHPCR